MKKYPLSTAAERVTGITFSVIMIAALGLLLYVLREDPATLLLSAVGVLLVTVVLVLYVLNVAKAACIHDPATNTLRVLGFRERTIDLNTVTCLQTITVRSGNVESRSLAFSNAEDAIVAVVPTYFTSKRGVLAEPMAKEMAADLGLQFLANVPVWEYDEEARKAHDVEVAKEEKAAAKSRREGKMKLRQAKIRQRMEESRSENEKP